MRSSRSRVWRAPGRANPTARCERRARGRSAAAGRPGAPASRCRDRGDASGSPQAGCRPRGLEAAERAAQPAAAEGHGDHHTGGGELDLAEPRCPAGAAGARMQRGRASVSPRRVGREFRRVRHRSRHTPRRPGGRTPPPELGTTSGAGRLPTRRPPTWRSRQHHPTGTHIYADRPIIRPPRAPRCRSTGTGGRGGGCSCWPPMGRLLGRQRGGSVAVGGEILMAVDTGMTTGGASVRATRG